MQTEPATTFTQTIDPRLATQIARLHRAFADSPYEVCRDTSEARLRLLATGQHMPPSHARDLTVEVATQMVDWLVSAIANARTIDAVRLNAMVAQLPKTQWAGHIAGVLRRVIGEALEHALAHATAIRQPDEVVAPFAGRVGRHAPFPGAV